MLRNCFLRLRLKPGTGGNKCLFTDQPSVVHNFIYFYSKKSSGSGVKVVEWGIGYNNLKVTFLFRNKTKIQILSTISFTIILKFFIKYINPVNITPLKNILINYYALWPPRKFGKNSCKFFFRKSMIPLLLGFDRSQEDLLPQFFFTRLDLLQAMGWYLAISLNVQIAFISFDF